MNIWQLITKEIRRRKLNFILGTVSVVLAVTAMVSALTLLRAHDFRTNEIIAAKITETNERMAVMTDDYRKIMKKLGFNLLILPEEQSLAELFLNGTVSKTMPEDYVEKLSASRIMTIRHLLPSLQQKIEWPEMARTIILTGTRGEVPLLHREPKEPILVPVPKGSMVIGLEIGRTLNLKIDDEVRLCGRKFTVASINEERGNEDDITVWIDLEEAQTLLRRPGLINAILALKCHCAGNSLTEIRAEVARILPRVRVIEQAEKVMTRADARDRAAAEAGAAIEAEIQNRERIRSEQEKFAAILVPVIFIASALWVGLLFYSNVKDRRSEIGLLRAMGLGSRHILILFLGKAFCMGIIAALTGTVLGYAIALSWSDVHRIASLFDPALLPIALIAAPLLALLASWIPAFLATQQDPAVVLRED